MQQYSHGDFVTVDPSVRRLRARGGRLGEIADAAIDVPETETYRIQELHLPVYHALCAALENSFF